MTLQHNSPNTKDQFGTSVALTDTLVIGGAPNRKVGTQSKAGAVYVFENGIQIKQLTANDAMATDYFGNSLAVSNGVLAVGAHGDNHATLVDAGSVYLFDVATWTQTGKVSAYDATSYDYFGRAIALKDNLLVVGAPSKSQSRGAVYVFGGTNLLFKLTSPANQTNEFFGCAVAITDDFIYVGASGNSNNRGAVYVYDLTGMLVTTITEPTRAVGNSFGASLAAKDSTLVIGTPNADTYTGKAYIYESNVVSDELFGVNQGDRFGFSVAIDNAVYISTLNEVIATKGTVVAVGKRLEDSEKGTIEI